MFGLPFVPYYVMIPYNVFFHVTLLCWLLPRELYMPSFRCLPLPDPLFRSMSLVVKQISKFVGVNQLEYLEPLMKTRLWKAQKVQYFCIKPNLVVNTFFSCSRCVANICSPNGRYSQSHRRQCFLCRCLICFPGFSIFFRGVYVYHPSPAQYPFVTMVKN